MRSILPRFASTNRQRIDKNSRTLLYLNVYDLAPINKYLYYLGLGIFHSGIEVHGMEYGFGAHGHSSSGVFEVEPKSCPGYIYRRSVCLGSTDMSRTEFILFLEHLSQKYHGDTYHLLAKNCNHFTDDVCMHLTGKSIPGWVNRVARLVSGSCCSFLLPGRIQVTTVRHLPDHSYPYVSEPIPSSQMEDGDEEQHHHQLLTPLAISKPARSGERPLKLAKDILWLSPHVGESAQSRERPPSLARDILWIGGEILPYWVGEFAYDGFAKAA